MHRKRNFIYISWRERKGGPPWQTLSDALHAAQTGEMARLPLPTAPALSTVAACRDLITPAVTRSARELSKTRLASQVFDFYGGACRDRTYDRRIKSPLLYQLS